MKRKINIELIGIALASVFITVILMLSVASNLLKTQVLGSLHSTGQTLKESGVFRKENLDSLDFDKDNYRITWIDTDGTVLYDNDVDVGQMENHAKRPEVVSAFKNGEGEAMRTSQTIGQTSFYYAVQLDDGTVLRISRVEDNIWSILWNVTPMILLIVAILALLSVALAQILTRRIIGPIEELTVNIDDPSITPAYRELVPFVNTIRAQHADILKSAKTRQDFTANVSHELKTPLTAISGYAELMENGMVEPEEVETFAAKIRKNAERLLTLINDIIRLSELDNVDNAVGFESVNLYEVAERCAENLKMYAARHEVNLTFEGEPVYIQANPDMIGELVTNLCDNAIRYNYKNGSVRIIVEKKDGHACLTVRDTGIGIPREDWERIFERFYRVDKSRSKQTGGTGLGLAIVKHIVEIHDADLTIRSERAKGTEICVTF